MDLYQHFKSRGLVQSRRDFSRLVGRAENYMCLRAGRAGREASADVLVGLFQNLWREGRLVLAVRVAWAVLWLPVARR